jgi:hypothetical protein
VLLGEPGVGKTAIVQGLAQRLTEGDVPDGLQSCRLIALELGLLMAGEQTAAGLFIFCLAAAAHCCKALSMLLLSWKALFVSDNHIIMEGCCSSMVMASSWMDDEIKVVAVADCCALYSRVDNH